MPVSSVVGRDGMPPALRFKECGLIREQPGTANHHENVNLFNLPSTSFKNIDKYVCVCSIYTYVCVGTYILVYKVICRNQRRMSGLSLIPLRQVLSLNQELEQQAPAILPTPPYTGVTDPWVQDFFFFYMNSGNLNLGTRASSANALTFPPVLSSCETVLLT